MAADTRMSTGYSILTRDYSKTCKLSVWINEWSKMRWISHVEWGEEKADKCVLASSGFQADVKALQKNLVARHLICWHQQQADELSCNGSTSLQYPLLQTFLPLLCFQCFRRS
eukprot:TRINITY_DN8960_c0_g1_i1.p1 TRINITY_DN8960_c0_g1~~TRINITY_DN8960_c0_g1_i1.p1  ORF type:complete len:113 (-),score=12.90 TRINITY_DN8960_c0_g1_i1:255-593(-)